MREAQKQNLLTQAKKHISNLRAKILVAIGSKSAQSETMSKRAIKMSAGDSITERRLVAHYQESVENLRQLHPSPYFARCDFKVNGVERVMYFGKFSFSEENIYSWITPAATLRFESPGMASYTRPDGAVQAGVIERKDQYMIVDGALLFFSTEKLGQPRELVYQENFTRQKPGFILPEVVEQMEKAQDQVIRASHDGPFIISGPAGSGKTTLALHRAAYLMQSPETAEHFPPESILVLVQDSGTKEYFSHLLPDLGIKGVTIVTFAEWAGAILRLGDHAYITNYEEYNKERYTYEYAKLQALRATEPVLYSKNIYAYLQKMYVNYLDAAGAKIFNWQKNNKFLDRFDITALLLARQKEVGNFSVEKEYYEELARGNYRKKKGFFPVSYNLMIIDEFQNYLPEQLNLLNSCINKRLKSMVYVGDVAQQTQLGTVRSWDDLGLVSNERRVILQKVYRNTKEILKYIQSRGYAVEVPEQLKSGPPVREVALTSFEEQISYIEKNILSQRPISIGILSKEKDGLEKFKEYFKEQTNAHCLSYYEAQGVEFDQVFIIESIDRRKENNYLADLKKEVQTVEKDLLYVALTRAMNELHILRVS